MDGYSAMSLRYLFLDLNAYFASVEQQDAPSLRGRPVAVSPLDIPSGCCIAVSYEAKRFGVKTGMRVAEARGLCPELVVAPSRPRRYVEMHHAVLKAIETCLPVRAVHSIDEVSCKLAPDERTPEAATALAGRIKRAIREQAGQWMRCSIGVAPNVFLGKVATDMQKPDGLVVIRTEDLPGKLLTLALRDLPGIGERMEERLYRKGIDTVEQLVNLSEDQLGSLWGSVVGRRWWYLLRGHDIYENPTRKRSIGHQHVLAPDKRNDHGAWEVAARLMHKAAARARFTGYWARHMSLSVRTLGDGSGDGHTEGPNGGRWGRAGRWAETATFPGGTQDTVAMLQALRRLWSRRPPGTPILVDVTLHELTNNASTTLPLFTHEQQRVAMSRAMDRINDRYGANTVYLASMHHARNTGHGGIAFSSIPDLNFHDSVRERQR